MCFFSGGSPSNFVRKAIASDCESELMSPGVIDSESPVIPE
ncbi:MAG: hypothetical protein M5U08_14835 [Burkholderiales bacterium]|nr:hypothetical protein [Burkholderiales bacterium]